MIITRTPFRISLFGGGTDFPAWYRENGGAVLSTTIDKYSYISLRKLPPFFDYKHKIIFFSKQEAFNELDSIEHPAVRETYRFMNVHDGLVMQHDADLPSHSGLGSSSSFTVGLLHALNALNGKMISKKRLALDAIHVEQELIGEAVGSQDQVAAAFGGLNKIVFSSQSTAEVRPFIISEEKAVRLQNSMMLFFTGFARFAVEIEKDKLQRLHQNRHSLSMMKSIVEAASDILDGDISGYDDIGMLLHESWILKKRLSNKVSTDVIDDIYARAQEHGAIGGKILGAGGGGLHPLLRPPGRARPPEGGALRPAPRSVPLRHHGEPGDLLHRGMTVRTPAPWHTESSRTVLALPPWFSVVKDTVRLPSGRVVDDFYRIEAPDYVLVAARDEAGSLLMERHYKQCLKRVILTAPAGGVDPGEAPLAAAQRELREETGYAAAQWRHLGSFTVDGTRGICTAHLFSATGLTKICHPATGDMEELEVVFMKTPEVAAALAAGEICLLPDIALLGLAAWGQPLSTVQAAPP